MLLAAFSLLFLAGCSGTKPVPVEGQVTLDGQAVEGMMVVFIPQDKMGHKHQAAALTDAYGHFALQTVNEQGALPGAYRVVVSKTALPPKLKPPKKMKDNLKGPKYEVQMVPAPFSSAEATPFTVEVPSGGACDLQIALYHKAKGQKGR